MMRVGLLGASRIAPSAIIAPAAVRDDVVVTAIAARDLSRATSYAGRYGIPVAIDSYEALVHRDDIDLVYCALPPAGHLDICLTALAAGKMVLIEKPFAIDSTAAETIADAARKAGRPALEAFHYRFHSQFARALGLVQGGTLGTIKRAFGIFNTTIPRAADELRWNAACGGGAMMDLGCYVLHALRTLMNGEPTVGNVRAELAQGVDVSVIADLSFAGVPAKLECAMDAATEARIVLEGSAGSLTLENFVAPQSGGMLVVRVGDEVIEEPAIGPTSYEAQLAHVVNVWAAGVAPLTGGDDAIATMRAIDACRRAAAQAYPNKLRVGDTV